MNQPLGRLAGNSVEVDESLAILAGAGPRDLRELTLALAAEALVMQDAGTDRERALAVLADHLDSGRAMEKFAELVAAQGGDLAAPRHARPAGPVLANHDGYLISIDVEKLGLAIIDMGGGRKQLHDAIDHSVGLEMLVRLGDRVERGRPCSTFLPAPTSASRLSSHYRILLRSAPSRFLLHR